MLEINIYSHNAILIVELIGPLNSQSSADLRRWFENQIEQGSIYIAVDFLDVEYISSTGMSALIEVHSLVKQAQGHLVLFNLNHEIQNLFHFIKLDKKIFISPDTKKAIDVLVQYKRDHPIQKERINNEKTNTLNYEPEKPNKFNEPPFFEEKVNHNTTEYPTDKQQDKEIASSKPISEPASEPISKTTSEPASEPISKTTSEPASKSISKPISEPTMQRKKPNQDFEILSCPHCKKTMKIKGDGAFMCPRCQNGIILTENFKKI